MTSLRHHIDGKVHYRFYRDGHLWYETDSGLLFPIPIADAGTACFNRDDKAIIFMRWIRKWLASVQQEKGEKK